MSVLQNVNSPRPMSLKLATRFMAGGVAGAALGFAVMKSATSLHVSPKSMTWADFLAVWIGITYLGIGLATYAISFNRKELARNLEGMEARLPATPSEVRTSRLQSVTLVLAGIMMLLPVFAMGSLSAIPNMRELIFLGIAILFALQTSANVMLWRGADEFLRRLLLLTCAVTFGIGQALLFLRAAAEHLGLVAPVSAWEILTLMMTLYIATGTWLSIRNRPGSSDCLNS